MDDLMGRFEEPVATRRWDNPLFVVSPTDPLPLEEINQALYHGKAVKASLATKVVNYSRIIL
jgi:tRNA uridine 5-carbamoylmethylation protein Kti12